MTLPTTMRKSKRHRKPKPFGRVHSYYRTFGVTHRRSHPNEYGNIVKKATRSFGSYEEAMVYVTNKQLGLLDIPYPYDHYVPYKVEECVHRGTRRRRTTQVIKSTTLAEVPESRHERLSVRWEEYWNRLPRQQWGSVLPLWKTVVYGIDEWEQLARSNWPTASSGSTATVVGPGV